MQAALHPALSIIRRRRRLLLFVCSSLAIMTPFAKPMSNKSRKRPHQQMGDDWAGLGVALSGRVAGGDGQTADAAILFALSNEKSLRKALTMNAPR